MAGSRSRCSNCTRSLAGVDTLRVYSCASTQPEVDFASMYTSKYLVFCTSNNVYPTATITCLLSYPIVAVLLKAA